MRPDSGDRHHDVFPVHCEKHQVNSFNTFENNTYKYKSTYKYICMYPIKYNTNTRQYNRKQTKTIHFKTIYYNTIQFNRIQYNPPFQASVRRNQGRATIVQKVVATSIDAIV